jgi:cyanophycinase-like exopeptidase
MSNISVRTLMSRLLAAIALAIAALGIPVAAGTAVNGADVSAVHIAGGDTWGG